MHQLPGDSNNIGTMDQTDVSHDAMVQILLMVLTGYPVVVVMDVGRGSIQFSFEHFMNNLSGKYGAEMTWD